MHNDNYAWLAQRNASHRSILHVPATTLKLHGISTGCYTVRWFDCTNGDWLTNATAKDRVCGDEKEARDPRLATPAFKTNIVAKITRTAN